MNPMARTGDSSNIARYAERGKPPGYVWADVLLRSDHRPAGGAVIRAKRPTSRLVIYRRGAGELTRSSYEPKTRPAPGPAGEDSNPPRPERTGGQVMRYLVIADDDQGATVAISPVAYEAAIGKQRRQVDDYGWTVRGTVRHWTRTDLARARHEGAGQTARSKVRACPVCDHVLEPALRVAGIYCPHCKPVITPDEPERAATVNRVAESAMDVIDRAVTDGHLPG
jgi:hypothetical protein